MIVLDTNIVLDLLVFQDPATEPLQQLLHSGTLQWLATGPMREELQRVLGYRQIVPRLAHDQRSAEEVLAQFDRLARLHAVSPKAGVTCADPDDQKFIDLAVAHRATLLSKDRAVLRMAKRLLPMGVQVQIAILGQPAPRRAADRGRASSEAVCRTAPTAAGPSLTRLDLAVALGVDHEQ